MVVVKSSTHTLKAVSTAHLREARNSKLERFPKPTYQGHRYSLQRYFCVELKARKAFFLMMISLQIGGYLYGQGPEKEISGTIISLKNL